MPPRDALIPPPAARWLSSSPQRPPPCSASGSLFGGVLGELRPEAAPASASPRLELDAALPLGGTAVAVRRLERAVRVDPRDAGRLGELGLAYQLRWRETGDPSFLPLSERALRRALRTHGRGTRPRRWGSATSR